MNQWEKREELVSEGLVTVKEAAEITRLGKTTLYEQMERGLLSYVRIGRARRIPRVVLRRFMASNLYVSLVDAES